MPKPQTVREQLLDALEARQAEIQAHPPPEDGAAVMVCAGCLEADKLALAAIERAKREPAEEDCCHQLDGCIEFVKDVGRP